jgi:hypothetical protein
MRYLLTVCGRVARLGKGIRVKVGRATYDRSA